MEVEGDRATEVSDGGDHLGLVVLIQTDTFDLTQLGVAVQQELGLERRCNKPTLINLAPYIAYIQLMQLFF